MSVLVLTLGLYMLGLLLAAVGSRLAGRCTTWCCALLGLPMWVVGGTIAPFCLALPQLMLALLAAGMGITGLAVGTALAGAVTNVGLALALCLLGGNGQPVVADRQEFLPQMPAAGAFLRGHRPVCAGRHPKLHRHRTTDAAVRHLCFVQHRLPAPVYFMASGTNRSLPTAAPPSPQHRITATPPAQWPSP